MIKQLKPSDIRQQIYFVRNHKIILDSHLAEYFDVPTKRLNEQVNRNPKRFPIDFVFRLTQKEFNAVKLESPSSFSGYGGRRYLPHGFTEHGATMAACLINTEQAMQASISIVRAFLQVRETVPHQNQIDHRLSVLESQTKQILHHLTKKEPPLIEYSPSTSTSVKSYENSASEILNQVAWHFGIKGQDLKRQNRKKHVTVPRQIAMYLIRKNAGLSLSEIGNYFGGRDHSTVLYACRKIDLRIQKDPSMLNLICTIEAAHLASTPTQSESRMTNHK